MLGEALRPVGRAMNELVARLVGGFALMVPALVLMLTGLGFVLAAIDLALVRIVDPPVAALATGGAAFAVAILLLLVAKARGSRRRRPVARPAVGPAAAADVTTEAAQLGVVLAEEGRRLLAGHAKGAAATALIAGIAVGISPRLRRAVWQWLR